MNATTPNLKELEAAIEAVKNQVHTSDVPVCVELVIQAARLYLAEKSLTGSPSTTDKQNES